MNRNVRTYFVFCFKTYFYKLKNIFVQLLFYEFKIVLKMFVYFTEQFLSS